MARPSYLFVGIFTFFSLLGSIIAMGFSLYTRFHCGIACQNSLFRPFITLGILLSVVSLLGLFCSWCKCDNLLYVHSGAMLLLIFVMAMTIGIVFIILNTNAGQAVVVFREHRLRKNWNGNRSCLIDAQVCRSVEKDTNQTTENLYQPIDCGFGFKDTDMTLFWTAPKSCIAVENNECFEWSNQQDRFCYYCNSCKAAILNAVKKWRNFAIVNICIVVLFNIIFCLGCCAMAESRQSKHISPLVDAP